MTPTRSAIPFVLLLAGCGGSSPAASPTTPRLMSAIDRPAPTPVAPRPVMQTYGLTGSLAVDEVRRALEPAQRDFADCFVRQSARLPTLGGRVTLAFHVATDGTVMRVHPIDSTIGHRDVERCVTDVARATRFPRPHGGEADFTWPLEMDPPLGVREPITWDPARVSRVVRARGQDVLDACSTSASTIQVTTYVSQRGRVLAAGASTNDPNVAASLDCIATAVRRWPMPRPGTRQAKVTFELRGENAG